MQQIKLIEPRYSPVTHGYDYLSWKCDKPLKGGLCFPSWLVGIIVYEISKPNYINVTIHIMSEHQTTFPYMAAITSDILKLFY